MEFKDLEHLENLIKNKIKENTNLEYKDPRSLNNNDKIVKSISAMANSNGGTIIYGLCDTDKDQAPEKIKWITETSKEETIQQILHSRITPKIDVSISTIENPKNKEEFVMIVQVPKSENPPHQDSLNKDEKRYWRRRGSIITQMEHYEIEDLFFKRKKPILKIQLEHNNNLREPIFNIVIFNEGRVIAKEGFLIMRVPEKFKIDGKGWLETSNDSVLREYEYYNQNQIPFYPGIKTNIGRIYLPKKEGVLEEFEFIFMITCEDMGIVEGKIKGNFFNSPDPSKPIEVILSNEGMSTSLPSAVFS